MGKKKSEPQPTLAQTADRHALYQRAVQNPKKDITFLQQSFSRIRRREAHLFREDFCGTAILSLEWCKRSPENTAVGVDIDEPTLEWAREHNLNGSGGAGQRVRLVASDVMTSNVGEKVDVLCAFNYSACLMKTRRDLLKYLRVAKEGLAPDGILALDLFGGLDAFQVKKYVKRFSDFTYEMDTTYVNLLTHEASFRINFKMPDKSVIKGAFCYDWRIWTLPELKEALQDAGFKHIEIWWAEVDPEDEEQYEYTQEKVIEPTEMFNSYILAYN